MQFPAPKVFKRGVVRERERLWFVDNMKAMLCLVVVAYHTGLMYTSLDKIWPVQAPINAAVLGSFFLIAGYFTFSSYQRKGTAEYCKKRLIRLGLPSLAWYILLLVKTGEGSVMIMWFTSLLLVLDLAYALWRKIGPEKTIPKSKGRPNNADIWAIIILAGTVTALVRMHYHLGEWFSLKRFILVETAHAPQFLAFFLFGLWAGRNNWMQKFSFRDSMQWLTMGMLGIVICGVYYILLRNGAGGWFSSGGLNRANVPFSLLSVFVSMAIPLGLIGLFRKWSTHKQSIWRPIAKNMYGIYFVHLVIVLKAYKVFSQTPLPPVLQYFAALIVSLVISWAISEFILCRIPWVKTIFQTYNTDNAPSPSQRIQGKLQTEN